MKNTDGSVFSYMDRLLLLLCPPDGSAKPPFEWEDLMFLRSNSHSWQLRYNKYLGILSKFGIFDLVLAPQPPGKKLNYDNVCNRAKGSFLQAIALNGISRAEAAEAAAEAAEGAANLTKMNYELAIGYQKELNDKLHVFCITL